MGPLPLPASRRRRVYSLTPAARALLVTEEIRKRLRLLGGRLDPWWDGEHREPERQKRALVFDVAWMYGWRGVRKQPVWDEFRGYGFVWRSGLARGLADRRDAKGAKIAKMAVGQKPYREKESAPDMGRWTWKGVEPNAPGT